MRPSPSRRHSTAARLVFLLFLLPAFSTLAYAAGPARRWVQLSDPVNGPDLMGARDVMLDAANDRLLVYTEAAIHVFDLGTRTWSASIVPSNHPPLVDIPYYIDERVLFDPVDNRLILVHGHEDGGSFLVPAATWILDLDSPQAWVKVASTGPFDDAPVVIDVAHRRLVSFGGRYDGWRYGDTHRFGLATSTWSVSHPNPSPPPRWEAEACFDETRVRMWMWGGYYSSDEEEGTLWACDLAGSPTWRTIPTIRPPGTPIYGILTHDPVRNRLLHVRWSGVLWTLDIAPGGASGTWSSLTPPGVVPELTPTAQVLDPARRRLIVVEGNRLWALPLGPPESVAPLEPDDLVVRAQGHLARVGLTLASSAEVRVDVFDVRGRRVAALDAGQLAAGPSVLDVPLSACPPGVYFVRATLGGATPAVRRIVLTQ